MLHSKGSSSLGYIFDFVYHCISIRRAHVCDAVPVKVCHSVVNFDDGPAVHWVSAQREPEVVWSPHEHVFEGRRGLFIYFI